MKSQAIFSFLRIATSFLYYAMIVLTVCLIGIAAISFSGDRIGPSKTRFSHEVMTFDVDKHKPGTYVFEGSGSVFFRVEGNGREAGTGFSSDSLIQYYPIVNHYQLDVKPNSVLGYYSFLVVLVNFLLIIGILWLFRRIFSEVNVTEPFKPSIFKHLITLAILFGVSDVLKLIHYLIFNKLIHRHLPNPHFDLVTEIGNGFITGLIIYAIAVVYQRGLSIQEENALTV